MKPGLFNTEKINTLLNPGAFEVLSLYCRQATMLRAAQRKGFGNLGALVSLCYMLYFRNKLQTEATPILIRQSKLQLNSSGSSLLRCSTLMPSCVISSVSMAILLVPACKKGPVYFTGKALFTRHTMAG